MRRSDELISLLREHSSELLKLLSDLRNEAERLKMRAYTRGFDYDYADFEALMDKTLNLLTSFIEVVQEVVDVLIDESIPNQLKQLLEQMSEKLDKLFQISRDAVKVSGVDRPMAESLFTDLIENLDELYKAAEEVANTVGLVIGLIEKRANEFDEARNSSSISNSSFSFLISTTSGVTPIVFSFTSGIFTISGNLTKGPTSRASPTFRFDRFLAISSGRLSVRLAT